MSGLPMLNEILSDIKGFSNKELEKQAEDWPTEDIIFGDICRFANERIEQDDMRQFHKLLKSCAESYHAKRCAECKKAKDSL